MRPEALLAIRSDIENAVEAEYLAWLTKEHTLERVGIEGFLSARIFRSKHKGFGRYLILYELADASVVDSPAYLERLNAPTPWTTRMMPHLGNFVRGGGAITTAFGAGFGAAVVPVLTEAKIHADDRGALGAFVEVPGVVAIRLLETDSNRTAVATNEKELRSGDKSFQTLLIVEAVDEAAARQVTNDLLCRVGAFEKTLEPEVPVYTQIFLLTR